MKKKIVSTMLIISMLLTTFLPVTTFASSNPSSWAIEEVNNAQKEGLVIDSIMKDYQANITREQFCELVMKLYERITGENVIINNDPFSDTDNKEVLKAYSLGIVKGISDNKFAPYNNITRQEICVMLSRCIDTAIDGSDITAFKTNYFADRNKIADWAINSVDYIYDNNIIKGVGNNEIDPLGNTKCEQSVLLIYRIFINKDNLIKSNNLKDNSKYIEEYLSILKKYSSAFENDYYEGNEELYNSDINPELYLSAYKDAVLYYSLKDLNNDSIPELFISAYSPNYTQYTDRLCSEYQIYDMYTIKNNKAVRLFDISSMGYRSVYTIRENGVMACMGSGGAFNSSVTFYKLGDNSLVYPIYCIIYDGWDGDKYFTGIDCDSANVQVSEYEWNNVENIYPLDKSVVWFKINDFKQIDNV